MNAYSIAQVRAMFADFEFEIVELEISEIRKYYVSDRNSYGDTGFMSESYSWKPKKYLLPAGKKVKRILDSDFYRNVEIKIVRGDQVPDEFLKWGCVPVADAPVAISEGIELPMPIVKVIPPDVLNSIPGGSSFWLEHVSKMKIGSKLWTRDYQFANVPAAAFRAVIERFPESFKMDRDDNLVRVEGSELPLSFRIEFPEDAPKSGDVPKLVHGNMTESIINVISDKGIATANTISMAIGASIEDVQKIVDGLKNQGVLAVHAGCYFLVPEKPVVEKVVTTTEIQPEKSAKDVIFDALAEAGHFGGGCHYKDLKKVAINAGFSAADAEKAIADLLKRGDAVKGSSGGKIYAAVE